MKESSFPLLLIFLTFAIFATFHSVCSQEFFKKKLEHFFGFSFVEYYWRLIYCTLSIVLLYEVFRPLLLMLDTYPIVQVSYEVEYYLKMLNFLGVLVTYWAFLQVDYLEFWGVKQAWLGLKTQFAGAPRVPFKSLAGVDRLEINGVFGVMRHPMLVGGFFMALAAPPSQSSLTYLGLYTIYMLVGGYYEEKRLRKNLGSLYTKYAEQVGACYPKSLNFKPKVFTNDL